MLVAEGEVVARALLETRRKGTENRRGRTHGNPRALDWTEFDRDGQTTIALYLLTRHGRATSLLWKTVKKTDPKEQQEECEDAIVELLHGLLEPEVRVTLLADRGVGDQTRYEHLDRLGFRSVIRFREASWSRAPRANRRPRQRGSPATVERSICGKLE